MNSTIEIHVEKSNVKAPKPVMTGAEIRSLAKPPIATDRDLFLTIPGGDDRRIGDAEAVELKSGMHFYSAPRSINPGAQQ